MDPIHHGDAEQKAFYETIEKLTDRELQEKQAHYLWNIEKHTRKTYLNVQFFFYLFVLSVIVSFVYMVSLTTS